MHFLDDDLVWMTLSDLDPPSIFTSWKDELEGHMY